AVGEAAIEEADRKATENAKCKVLGLCWDDSSKAWTALLTNGTWGKLGERGNCILGPAVWQTRISTAPTLTAVDFAADGTLIAVGTHQGNILIAPTAGDNVHAPVEHPARDPKWPSVLMVSVSADGRFIASGGVDGRICVWSAEGARLFDCIGHIGASITGLAFDIETSSLLSADGRGTVMVSSLLDGAWLSTLPKAPQGCTALTVTKPGSVAVALADGSATIWKYSTGLRELQISGHGSTNAPANKGRSEIHCIAFDQARSLLATGGGDGTVRLWNAATGGLAHTFISDAPISCLSFSSAGFLAFGDEVGKIRGLDVRARVPDR
ncbi:MAG: hypothetical protein ABL897_05070, partial [Hyphomicrobium sp.]